MKRRAESGTPVFGAGLLLTAFGVLCLTVFTLLSLTTAQAETRMAEASHQAVFEYYAADLQAEEMFARLRAGENPSQARLENGIYSYRCPISENQYLAVELEHREDGWVVHRWQAVAEQQTGDDTLQVWNGNQEETP